MKVKLTEDQFLIAIGMSEAKIISLIFSEQKLYLKATGIDILFDFSNLKIHNPNISYDDWLGMKYLNTGTARDKFKHIFVDDEVEFIIDQPQIYYEGNQEQFFSLLNSVNLNTIDNTQHKYIFGGTYENSSHDEFEIHTKSPIELSIPAGLFNHEEDKTEKFNKAIEKVKRIQEGKGNLKKRKNNQQFLLQV